MTIAMYKPAQTFGGDGKGPNPKEKLQADIQARFGERQKQLAQGLSQVNAAPGFSSTDQNQLISQLLAASRGEGPSAAQAQLQQATDQNMRQALAYAASSRGNPALAQQAAGRQIAQAGQQAAAQSAALRAGEQQAAQGLAQQAIMGRIGAEQQAAAQQDLMRRFYEQGISDILGQQTQGELGVQGLISGDYQAEMQKKLAQQKMQKDQENAIIAGILGMGQASASAAAMG